MDGTHVRFRRPGDSGTRKDMYSYKTFTGNTILFVAPTGPIVAMSDTYEGRTADITATRQFLPQWGEFTKNILQDSRAGKEFKLDGDLGFPGLGKNVPGAKVRTPEKRPRGTKKEKGKLTPEQKAYNKEFNKSHRRERHWRSQTFQACIRRIRWHTRRVQQGIQRDMRPGQL